MTIENVYVLLVCRVLRGVITGTISVILPLFMNEIINSNLKAPLLGLIHVFMTFGSLNVYIVAINSPYIKNANGASSENYCASVENKHMTWRELFLIPIIPALLKLFLLIFVFKSDSDNLGKCYMTSFHLDILQLINKVLILSIRYAKRIHEKQSR